RSSPKLIRSAVASIVPGATEDLVWVKDFGANCVVAIDSDGKQIRSVSLPATGHPLPHLVVDEMSMVTTDDRFSVRFMAPNRPALVVNVGAPSIYLAARNSRVAVLHREDRSLSILTFGVSGLRSQERVDLPGLPMLSAFSPNSDAVALFLRRWDWRPPSFPD